MVLYNVVDDDVKSELSTIQRITAAMEKMLEEAPFPKMEVVNTVWVLRIMEYRLFLKKNISSISYYKFNSYN